MIDKNDPRLTAFVLGELDTSEQQEIEQAVNSSPELREVVKEIAATVELLKQGFSDELRERPVAIETRHQSLAERPIARTRLPWAIVATLLIGMLGLAGWYFGVKRMLDGDLAIHSVSEASHLDLMSDANLPVKKESPSPLPAQQGIRIQHGELKTGSTVRERDRPVVGVGGGVGSSESVFQGDVFRGGQIELRRGNLNLASAGEQGGQSLPAYELPANQGRYSYDDLGHDRYDYLIDNDFLRPTSDPLSTFSIDVDTASYSHVRNYLTNYRNMPPAGAVRIEELINYFPYQYAPPTDDVPFAAHQMVATCPWNPEHQLVRIALKGKEIAQDRRPPSNLVFLIDVSGSMDSSKRLPLVQRGIRMLVEQLTENDRVAMVVYAGAAGVVLNSTTGEDKELILHALDRLKAGGSTNGGDGIKLAYSLAHQNFIPGGVNRVILCTDGDFNVGVTSNDELVRLVEAEAKKNVFISVLGFGMGNANDSMLELISNRGNGNYAYVDTDAEARKVLVEQMAGTLITIAKDVKIQVEFNPARVAAYRLIGYENRVMAAQDFNDDRKDAGEIGAGHCVTALYEIIPAGETVPSDAVDELKYQTPQPSTEASPELSEELLTLKIRYKDPEGDTSELLSFPLLAADRAFSDADADFQFAAAVASFGMLLRDSKWKGNSTYDAVLEVAESAAEFDPSGYRQGFLAIVRLAREHSKR